MRNLSALVGIAAGIGTAAAPALAVNLCVAHLEISQATQDDANGIDLVAGRATVVRATVVSDDGSSVPGVHGRLFVYEHGTVPPGTGRAPLNETRDSTLFTVPATTTPAVPLNNDQLAQEANTMNFEVGLGPPGDPQDPPIPASTMDFQVTLAWPGGSSISMPVSKVFQTRVIPHFYTTSITYPPYMLQYPFGASPDPNRIKSGTADALLRGILPVDTSAFQYHLGSYPPFTFSEGNWPSPGALHAGQDPSLVHPPAGDDLLNDLASSRQLIVNNDVGAMDRVFMYGWVAAHVVERGDASIGGRVAFGEYIEPNILFSPPTNYQREYAHETLHNFGFGHTGGPLDRVGWDVGARLENNPPGNGVTGRVKWQWDPTHMVQDVMVPELYTNRAWITTTNYTHLLSSPTLNTTVPDLSTFVLVVHGILSSNGYQLLRLDPAFRYPWQSEPTRSDPNLKQSFRYQLEVSLVGQDKPIQVPFDAEVSLLPPPAGEASTWGFFEVMVKVPVEEVVQRIRIWDSRTQQYFSKELDRSNATPEVSNVSMSLGANGDATVTWEVQDADGDKNFMAQVVYSPNSSGNDFVPIGVNLTTNSLTLDSPALAKLPPSTSSGSGRICVFVSDGLNTSLPGQLTGLTTP